MSSSIWEVMLPAFAECLVLTGLHAYLGLHVLQRKVIFVDLTLAQIAALGTTVGALFGMSTASPGAYVLSLAFTFLGAAVFALTRTRKSRVPQEAVIGLVYAIAAALAILLVSQAPNGAKQVQEIMTGRLLWVDWGTVGVTAIVYGSLGLLHFAMRRRFLLISEDPEQAFARGMRVWGWDFLFYVSFGLAISLSVRTAGVLLVFVFLVVPAMVALTFAERLRTQLFIGWGFGLLTTASGLALSYAADLSSGPTVVALYGALLVPVALVAALRKSSDRKRTWLRAGIGTAVALAVAVLFWLGGSAMSGTRLAHSGTEHADAHASVQQQAEPKAAEPKGSGAEQLLREIDAAGIDGQDAKIAAVGSPELLEAALKLAEDGSLKVGLARRLAQLAPQRGASRLIELIASDLAPFERSEAADALKEMSGEGFGIDPEADAKGNAAALEKARAWVERGAARSAVAKHEQ
jgi:zinc/manganese transport system permease protein